MVIILLLTISFLLPYTVFVLWCTQKWSRSKNYKLKNNRANVSVIVAFRNEKESLPALLSAIEKQTFLNFELILVDDHSTDGSETIYKSFLGKISKLQQVTATSYGKKNALLEGIAVANGDLIVVTDADCSFAEEWLQAIADFYVEKRSDFIIAPVKIKSNSIFFEEIQALEFLSLQAVTAGMSLLKKPIMANGANMAFAKSFWNKAKSELCIQQASGDDMFLLQAAKKMRSKIDYLKNEKAIVETRAAENISAFLSQRMRWSGKASSYTDVLTLTIATMILSLNLLLLVVGVDCLLEETWRSYGVLIFIFKMLVDTAILSATAPFFKLQKTLKWIPILSIVYPIYVLVSVVGGLLKIEHWKGRKV